MATIAPAGNVARATGFTVVVLGGLAAGTLDLTFACIYYGLQGATPARILQSIASGVLGRDSFHMGAASAALGAFFHFFISVCAATVYYLASRWLPILTRRVVICGAAFGVLMYLTMHFVVVPLSAIGPRPAKTPDVIGELGSHIFLFGIVIAFAVRRALTQRPPDAARPDAARPDAARPDAARPDAARPEVAR